MVRLVVFLVSAALQVLRAVCRPREDLAVENLAFRQQVATLLKQRPRPDLDDVDRAFWVALRRSWPKWMDALIIVQPGTVARWHRERFRRHWAKISRRPGRPRIDAEVRELIHEMARHGWGAPRIHGELMKLGFGVSEGSVSRYMPRRPVTPNQLERWIAFLRNHKEAIAAMDFFSVPTISLKVLYGFFVIDHGRRRILHFNATLNPTVAWVIQQHREAFPFDGAPRYLIFDRDSIFSAAVVKFVEAMGTSRARAAPPTATLAEPGRGTMDRYLPSGAARPRSRVRPTSSRSAAACLRELLPRRPLPSRAEQRRTIR